MKAIILAAGRGSRLEKHTRGRPKCLNTVWGKPIIEWIIKSLRAGGVDDIVLVTGYRADMLAYLKLRTIHNADWERTNMVSSLLCAKDEFDEPLIVSYSDIIYTSSVVELLIHSPEGFQVLYDPDWQGLWESRFENPLSDAESFKIDNKGRITEIGNPVENMSHVQGQYMGVMKFDVQALDQIVGFLAGRDYRQLDMTGLLSLMIKDGYRVGGTEYTDRWVEIDTPSDLALAPTIFTQME